MMRVRKVTVKQNKALETHVEGVFPELIRNPDSGFRHLAFAGRQKKGNCQGITVFAKNFDILFYPHIIKLTGRAEKLGSTGLQ